MEIIPASKSHFIRALSLPKSLEVMDLVNFLNKKKIGTRTKPNEYKKAIRILSCSKYTITKITSSAKMTTQLAIKVRVKTMPHMIGSVLQPCRRSPS